MASTSKVEDLSRLKLRWLGLWRFDQRDDVLHSLYRRLPKRLEQPVQILGTALACFDSRLITWALR
jgi:hypothetical protein